MDSNAQFSALEEYYYHETIGVYGLYRHLYQIFWILFHSYIYIYVKKKRRQISGPMNIGLYTQRQKAQRSEWSTKEEGQQHPHPQHEPNQSKKLTRVKKISFINILISNQRK